MWNAVRPGFPVETQPSVLAWAAGSCVREERGGRMMTRYPILVTLVLVLFACGAFGQNTASLNGTVTDPSGAVVPGVTVTATDIATNIPYPSVTNEKGEYRLRSEERRVGKEPNSRSS